MKQIRNLWLMVISVFMMSALGTGAWADAETPHPVMNQNGDGDFVSHLYHNGEYLLFTPDNSGMCSISSVNYICTFDIRLNGSTIASSTSWGTIEVNLTGMTEYELHITSGVLAVNFNFDLPSGTYTDVTDSMSDGAHTWSGGIQPSTDGDYFKYTAPQNGTLNAEADDTSGGLGWDTDIFLFSSGGWLLAYDIGDWNDGNFSYDVTGGNTYYILVRGDILNDWSGESFTYNLILSGPTGSVTGACCFESGSCYNYTSSDCSSAGGVYQGNGTSCSTVTCPCDTATPPAPNAPTSAEVGDTITISASGGYSSYDWQLFDPDDSSWDNFGGSGSSASITVDEPGTWYFRYKRQSSGCAWSGWGPSDQTTVTCTTPQPPAPNAPSSACMGDTITISASGGYSSYDWQSLDPGDSSWDDFGGSGSSASINVNEAGTWKFRYKRLTLGCEWSEWGTYDTTAVSDCTPTGACCNGTSCSVTTQSDCNSGGGVYQGDNVPCDSDTCSCDTPTPPAPSVSMSACIGDTITISASVGYSSYDWQSLDPGDTSWDNFGGSGSSASITVNEVGTWYFRYKRQSSGCDWSEWGSSASTEVEECIVGACCFYDNAPCEELTPVDCLYSGGEDMGDGTTCAEIGCTVEGACCLYDYSCYQITWFDCYHLYSGNFHEGLDCSPNPCLPTGACCNQGQCSESTEEDCNIFGGIYNGDDTVCATDTCSDGDGMLYVPSEYATIQIALNTAVDGDEIIVGPGTYTGTGDNVVDTLGKAITLRSEDPADEDVVFSTIIDGENARRCIACTNGETNATIIEGFTIQNGEAPWFDWNGDGSEHSNEYRGGGILISSSSPTIQNCWVYSNNANRGGGMYSTEGANLSVNTCRFELNDAGNGGAVYVISSDVSHTPSFTYCEFLENTAEWYGGAIYNHVSFLQVDNCAFVDNIASNDPSSDDGSGGAIRLKFADAMIHNCLFEVNTAQTSGGAIQMYSSTAEIMGCEFANNRALTDAGGAIRVAGDGLPSIGETEFCDNRDTDNQVIRHIYPEDAFVDLGENVFLDLCIDCPDVNGDGMVGVNDLLEIVAAWGTGAGPADLDNDGVVGVNDLLMVVGGWGPCA